jgi:chromosomal replication initiator protein
MDTAAVESAEPRGSVPAPEPAPSERRAELDLLWSKISSVLREGLQRSQYETWFRRIALLELDSEHVRIAVSNAYARDWLQDFYSAPITQAIAEVLGSPRALQIVVDPERAAPTAPNAVPAAIESVPTSPAPQPLGLRRREEVERRSADRFLAGSDVVLNPHYRFDAFIVGPCNRFAHAACVGVAERPGTYNPLFIHGSVGLGKTHLMQSLCRTVLERNPGARILFLSCETFVNHFLRALEKGELDSFREKYRSVDVLVVDDIHLLANKQRTQEEFFHTFNALYNAGSQIVLSSDSPPVAIPTLDTNLTSRFGWGLVTKVEPPCFETRVAILKRKSRDRGRELADDVARFVAERIETNVRELEGAVNRVLGFSGLSGQEISLQLVRQCLAELFTHQRGLPSTEDIMRVITARFGVKSADIQSRRRTNAIAFPRQVGMYLARRLTRMSLEEIGGFFGGRDHSTVLYGVEKVARLAREDPHCRTLLTELTLELQGSLPDGPL